MDKIKYDFLLEKKSEGFFSKTRDSILKKIKMWYTDNSGEW